LQAEELKIFEFPVKQQDSKFEHVEKKMPSTDTSFVRSGGKVRAPVTTYSKVRARQLKARNKAKAKRAKRAKKTKKKKLRKRKRFKKRKILRAFDFDSGFEESTRVFGYKKKDLDPMFLMKVRALELPLTGNYDTTYKDDVNLLDENDTSLVKPAAGNVELDGAHMLNFNNDANTPFNILMKNGAKLSQAVLDGTDVQMTANQYINIDQADKKINTIEVSRTFEVNDNFRLAPGADLEVRFVDGQVVDRPVFRFAANMQLDMEADSVVRFRGKGIVELDSSVVINMMGIRTQTGTDSEGRPIYTVTQRPVLDVGPDVQVQVVGSGEAFITGVGTIKVSGSLQPNSGTLHLWPRATDDIVMQFEPNGTWLIDGGSKSTTGLGTGVINFRKESSLQVINGELAVNDQSVIPVIRAPGDTLTRGWVENLTFEGNAKIIVGKDGIVSWGRHAVTSSLRAVEYPMTFAGSSLELVTEPGAIFNLVARPAADDPDGLYRGFEGAQVQTRSKGFFTFTSAISREVAYYFTNVNSNLTLGSIEFVTTDGQRKVRTAAGVVVDIQPNDIIFSDSIVIVNGAEEVQICGQRGTKDFYIRQDGTFI